MAVCQQVI